MVYQAHPQDLRITPNLSPRPDETFSQLLQGALRGDVPVYFAAVPLFLCVPFDRDYRPDLEPVGRQAITRTIDEWLSGRFHRLLVYPHGRWFVVADDYIPLFAALEGQPDYVPCWVLGEPDSDLVEDVQGPIATDAVASLLGLRPAQ